MATFVNDLRLTELATGEGSGTWGTTTNQNLSLLGEAFSFGTEAITTNADTHTTTIADGSTDPGRSLFLKYTGTLDSACTITIGPNTVSKLWFIENATSGGFSIIISQGSGANITIPNGQTKAIYSDGAGSGAAMVDAFQDLSIPDLFVDDDLTVGDDLILSSDSAIIKFGADADTTLTHTDGSGLTLNSTNKIMFNDASQFIQGSSATVLSLGATDEIDLTATAIDVNGTIDVSGNATLGGTLGVTGAVTADAGISIDNITIDGTEIDLSSGDLTIDVAGDITLDAAGDQINFHSGGTARGYLDLSTGGLILRSLTSDADIILQGTDGSSSVNAITLDMSAAGKATFNAGIVVNESGGDNNTRFEGDSVTSLLEIDASTDRIGIGTSAPSEQVHIQNANDAVLLIESSGSDATDDANVQLKTTNGTFTIQNDRSIGVSGALTFAGSSSNVLVLDHANSLVGLGTASPQSLLHLSSTSPTISMTDTNSFTDTNDRFIVRAGADIGLLQYYDDSASTFFNLMEFGLSEINVNDNSNDRDFRVESDGNANMLIVDGGSDVVLVGTNTINPQSASSGGNEGCMFGSGLITAGRAGGEIAIFNRQSSDGDVVLIRKDGSTVGSISTEGGDMAIGNDDAGIQFVNGTEHFRPFTMASNAATDGLMDIGSSSKRFKDLHLSGTANTGLLEVASANTTLANFQANVGGAGGVGVVNIKTNTSSSNGLQLVGNGSGASIAGGSLAATVQNTENGPLRFGTNSNERARITEDGDFLVGSTTVTQLTSAALTFDVSQGRLVVTADGGTTEPLILNRHDSDGTLVEFRQANTVEGTISVSGSTVSYNGFSGSHDSSGIPSDTELGTVCSTIDELDTYPDTRKDLNGNDEDHPKKGQTRPDHAKIKVSDSVGDARVYGVLGGFQKDGKPVVVSVGIGSVRVTGSCSGGDLLESNGDGTAKVQSDDIIRSKTIGKVTIGNSTSSVKLVSCVLYCG